MDTMLETPTRTGLFSADSHVMEPVSAWEGVLPASFWPKEGSSAGRWGEKGGGFDPEKRSAEMAEDGVIAEVLYPSRGLSVFSVEDPETHEAGCRAYNDWLIEYCSVEPERLLGVGMIPSYDADRAIEEIRYCHEAGFRGVMLWEVPHPDLPFQSPHYEPIWNEVERLNLPLSFHILTGFKYGTMISGKTIPPTPHIPVGFDSPYFQSDRLKRGVNLKVEASMDLLVEFIMTGILERHPGLRIVIVENEIGWVPFSASRWDFFHAKRYTDDKGNDVPPAPLSKPPSGYLADQVYATFFQDALSRTVFETFGSDTFMWSNDYPHPNSLWPNSRQWIDENLGGLAPEILQKVLRTNAERLYGPVPDSLG